jgi:hypothetical protein
MARWISPPRDPYQPVLRLFSALLLAGLQAGAALAMTQEEADTWLEADEEVSTAAVNEGELAFLNAPTGHRVLQTHNYLTVSRKSLADGWVALYQCQGELDPVPAVEIVYRYHAMRNLHILSSRGIGRARVAGASVQLEDVQRGAEVCIGAEVRVLEPAADGRHVLQSGPFHRRFLDGYYPVHLDYRVSWPPGLLDLDEVQPPAQAGFAVDSRPGELSIDTLFEGRLTIRVGLRANVDRDNADTAPAGAAIRP